MWAQTAKHSLYCQCLRGFPQREGEIKRSLKAKQPFRHWCFSNFDSFTPNQDWKMFGNSLASCYSSSGQFVMLGNLNNLHSLRWTRVAISLPILTDDGRGLISNQSSVSRINTMLIPSYSQRRVFGQQIHQVKKEHSHGEILFRFLFIS